MAELASLFALDLFRHAVLAALLASVLCGVVGTFVVLKRLVAASGGIAHAAFGGLGAFYWLGLPPRLGAVGVAAAVSLVLSGSSRTARGQDAAIGVVWAVGMAIGLIFIHLTPGYAPSLMGFLFGDILLVSPGDLWLAAVADLVVIVHVLLFGRRIVAVAFDEECARLQGIRVRAYSLLLLLLTALTIVVLLRLVGIVLVIALLTIPPLVALRLWRGLGAVVAGAVGVAALQSVGGLLVAFRLDLPAGPVIVLLGALLLGLVQLRRPPRRRAAPGTAG
ncbi:MAG: metal ABC transporter permease [Acidobacteria bacterium]|jgi:zinc transport system permease protein|nr:metal ABC transporter permease [Thermoanaerobaculia bacterium]MDI9630295.1 metal ABC transporter permease [Acidobacteriota bacterium]OQC41208.1 MAG: High-affinity zinc uptake system membrane protein ZnuB [Acidobacteria bacterium ADurb.Bin051]MBP7812195.1 metal ABC transporter permease [Thermoanaerobaculia bacterium]MBP8844646.1 metal ABC transporter permease [Thermoanaerobaculia bacterium]